MSSIYHCDNGQDYLDYLSDQIGTTKQQLNEVRTKEWRGTQRAQLVMIAELKQQLFTYACIYNELSSIKFGKNNVLFCDIGK